MQAASNAQFFDRSSPVLAEAWRREQEKHYGTLLGLFGRLLSPKVRGRSAHKGRGSSKAG